MKLKELIESNLVKDGHYFAVTVSVHGSASQIGRGNWFHDQNMDVMEREIKTIEYQIGGLWYINLTHDEDD